MKDYRGLVGRVMVRVPRLLWGDLIIARCRNKRFHMEQSIGILTGPTPSDVLQTSQTARIVARVLALGLECLEFRFHNGSSSTADMVWLNLCGRSDLRSISERCCDFPTAATPGSHFTSPRSSTAHKKFTRNSGTRNGDNDSNNQIDSGSTF